MTETRDEIMLNFQAMTNKTDLDECIAILESSNWDLNRAVSAALEEDDSPVEIIDKHGAKPKYSSSSADCSRRIPIMVENSQQPLVTFPSEADLENMMHDEINSVVNDLNVNPFSRLFDHTQESSTSITSFRQPHRAIYFKIEQSNGAPIDIVMSEADTVEMLEAQVSSRTPDIDFRLVNWPGGHQPDSDTVLRSLHLPRSVTLKLVTAVEDTKNGLTHIDDEALNRKYQLMLHDKQSTETYTFTRNGGYSVTEVKQDAEDLTGIAIKQQIWTGWPAHITNDMTLAACNLDLPVHHLYLGKTQNDTKSSMSVTNQSSSAYISDDDYEYYPLEDDIENYHPSNITSPIKVHSIPKRNTLPLIPENIDSITAGTLVFGQVFESRYGSTHPVFFVGDLAMALAEANRTERLLAVYLHQDASIAANVFPAVVLCNSQISEMLTCQAVLWPWDLTQDINSTRCLQMIDAIAPDSSMMRSLDRCPTDQYPLLIFMSSREAGRLSQPLAVISGADSAQMVQAQLQEAIAENVAQFADARRHEQEREERDRFRKEQEKAYEDSLATDRQRIERREQEEREEKERLKRDQDEMHRRDALLRSIETASKESKTAVTLRIRLPDGKMHDYRFEPDAKLKTLFDLIDGHGFTPETHTLDTNDKPKRRYTLADQNKALCECVSSKRELITVSQKIEEEEDDE